MATKEPKEKKKSAGAPPGAKQPKGEGKKKKGGEPKTARVPHAGTGLPAPACGTRAVFGSPPFFFLPSPLGCFAPGGAPALFFFSFGSLVAILYSSLRASERGELLPH